MKTLALAALAAISLTASASAAPSWTTYSDPKESAFTLQVPQGWRIAGETQRMSETNAAPWVTALSPDTATFVFYGDPNLPQYSEPNQQMHIVDGTWTNGVAGLVAVMPYRPGADYAALYGQRTLASTCGKLQQKSKADRPDLAQAQMANFAKGNVHIPGTRADAGTATFTCEIKGKPFTAQVTALTALFPLPAQTGGGGIWFVAKIYGFRAPVGGEAIASTAVEHMDKTFNVNAQWEKQMTDVIRQKGAAMREQSQRRADAFSAQLRQEGQQLAATMQSRQSAYMSMMTQREDDRTNTFNDHMRAKAWGQFNEMLYINDQHCAWNDAHTKCVVVHN